MRDTTSRLASGTFFGDENVIADLLWFSTWVSTGVLDWSRWRTVSAELQPSLWIIHFRNYEALT